MTWHYEHQTESGLMVHPSDGEAWKHFDSNHPEFASEPRNVCLGLCTDGLFEDYASQRQPAMDDEAFGRFRDQHFARWFEQHVNSDYFRLLNEVLEVEYQGMGRCIVVLFKCTWFDPIEGVKVLTKYNLVDIKYKSRLRNDDPFILASQVEQVYYVPYPSMKGLKDWWAVIKTKPRGIYELRQCVSEEDDDEEDQFFQESETLIPYASSSANEAEEPTCLVIEGEIQVFDEDEYGEDGEDEEEYDDNLDDSDEDGDDEVELCDDYFSDECFIDLWHQALLVVVVVVMVVEIMVVVEILNHKILEKVSLLLFLLEDQTYWIKFQVTRRKGSSLKWSPMMSIFSDHPEVIRDITCILKTMFRGTWDSWKSIDKDDREAMWCLFKNMYEWPEESDGLARKVWEICMKKRIPDTLKKARDAALAAARDANVNVSMQGDLTFLKPHKPNWIKENDWHSLIDTVWNTPKWKILSRSATENRNKLQDGSVSKHCAGSISTKQHKKRMEVELERLPSGVKVYSKLHIQKSTQQYITPKAARVQGRRLVGDGEAEGRSIGASQVGASSSVVATGASQYLGFNKPSDHGQLRDGETQTKASHRISHDPKDYLALGVSNCGVFTSVEQLPSLVAYEETIVAKYGDDTSCYPLLDSQIWLEVSGGKKKGRVFGFGSISDPESFLTGTSSTATSREIIIP
ncbi:hypothetical protein LXL04_010081 [Taraxacum kok-saghyz]